MAVTSSERLAQAQQLLRIAVSLLKEAHPHLLLSQEIVQPALPPLEKWLTKMDDAIASERQYEQGHLFDG